MDSPGTVFPPAQLWRVGRSPDPLNFSTIDPGDAVQPNGGNRFDVPGGEVLYAASQPEGAFAETLARFRPTTSMRALPPEDDEHLMAAGAIPADWRTRRLIARFGLDDPLPFLDVDNPTTHTYLNAQMAPWLEALGVAHLDVAIMRGSNRLVTRAVAEWAYVATNDDGQFLYSGLRYESRLGAYECWAVFAGASLVRVRQDAIAKTDDRLGRVARTFDLTIH